MASKSGSKRDKGKGSATTPDPASPAGQNVWLAGLGALAQAQADAQAEGQKAFEALVQQGMEMQAQAQQQISEAAERLSEITTQATGAGDTWNRLGSIFENRVARAMTSMGMPPPAEVISLRARVQALEEAVEKLQVATKKKPAKKAAARKTAGKSTKKDG